MSCHQHRIISNAGPLRFVRVFEAPVAWPRAGLEEFTGTGTGEAGVGKIGKVDMGEASGTVVRSCCELAFPASKMLGILKPSMLSHLQREHDQHSKGPRDTSSKFQIR